jgi:hypothetical protein
MLSPLIHTWNLNLGYAKRLVADIPDDQMAFQPAPGAHWSEPTPIEEVRGFLPALGDSFVFVMAAHENMHLGQLSAWRRVQGMGRV